MAGSKEHSQGEKESGGKGGLAGINFGGDLERETSRSIPFGPGRNVGCMPEGKLPVRAIGRDGGGTPGRVGRTKRELRNPGCFVWT